MRDLQRRPGLGLRRPRPPALGRRGRERPHRDSLERRSSSISTGTESNDVAVGQAGQFYLLNGRNGASLYRPIEVNRVVQNSAAVADFGPGYGWRLIIQSWLPLGDGLPKDGAGRVESFHLPKAPATAPAWPQWRLATRRTPHRRPPRSAPANAGYWLVSRTGDVFAFGNAKNYGSTACTTPEAADRRHGCHAVGPRLLARRTQRERLRFRRCEVARHRRLQASHPANRRDRADRIGSRLLAHRPKRRRVRLRRRGDAWSHRGETSPASDRRGRARRGRATAIGSSGAPATSSRSATRRSTGRPGRSTWRSPSSGSRRHRRGHGYWLVGRSGHVFAFGDARSSARDPERCRKRSSGSPELRPAAATGSSGRTATSSRSATRCSSAHPAGCTRTRRSKPARRATTRRPRGGPRSLLVRRGRTRQTAAFRLREDRSR